MSRIRIAIDKIQTIHNPSYHVPKHSLHPNQYLLTLSISYNQLCFWGICKYINAFTNIQKLKLWYTALHTQTGQSKAWRISSDKSISESTGNGGLKQL